jgi:hypothetical protein
MSLPPTVEQERASRAQMLRDAIEVNEADGNQAMVERLTELLTETLGGGGDFALAARGAAGLTEPGRAPEGGQQGANQFGTYVVRYPSEKQTRYVQRLLDTRIVPDEGGERSALEAFRGGKANLRQTSRLIDWLTTLPERPANQQPTRLASDKQMTFVRSLIDQRDLSGLSAEDARRVDIVRQGVTPSAKGVSALIDTLNAQPRITTARDAKGTELEDGFYVLGDDVYKVVHAVHGSGNQYAKILVKTPGWTPGCGEKPGRFEYAPGAVTRIARDGHKMTREDGARLGKLYEMCIRCGATLTREDSIERFMGRVCYGKTH